MATTEETVRALLGISDSDEITCISGDYVYTADGLISVETASYCQGCPECDPCIWGCQLLGIADPDCEAHAVVASQL